MNYHLCIPIHVALDRLDKGQNFLDCSHAEARRILIDHRAQGYTHYTGCDNVDTDGSCRGHKSKEK